MRENAIKARQLLFGTSCLTSALYLTAVGIVQIRKALIK
jgi:hypothetical protein